MPFRNIETHFSQAPQAKVKRSSFKYNMPVKMTFNAGDLVPFMCEEVLPGDTFDLKLSKVVRLTSSIHPTMDNLYLDTYFFFVPNRFIWDNWTKFMGENDKAWTQNTVYVPPKLACGGTFGLSGTYYQNGGIDPQSILNYLMLPAFADGSKKKFDASLFPLNSYIKVWNDWFRSESLIDECPMYTGDSYIPSSYQDSYYLFTGNFGSNKSFADNGSCLKVAKFADYFTRALPQPQKGADVLIPAGGDVIYNGDWSSYGDAPNWVDSSGNEITSGSLNATTSGATLVGSVVGAYDPKGTLSLAGLEITVNNLRLAMQTQKLLERDARGGWARA